MRKWSVAELVLLAAERSLPKLLCRLDLRSQAALFSEREKGGKCDEMACKWYIPLRSSDGGHLVMRATEKQVKLADELMKLEQPGHTIYKSLMDAGYCESQAKQGWAGVPKKVIQLIAKKGARLVEFGSIDAATQEKLVRGRLVYNTIKGSDKGVLSAKALGSDRRVAMFQPDAVAGIIVIQAPTRIAEDQQKILEAEE